MNTSGTTSHKPRDYRFDALRGLLLIVMTAVHLPTPVSHLFQEPLGCFGSAEGFVLLAACLAGMIYGRAYDRDGWRPLVVKASRRAGVVYAAHLALLLPIALFAWGFSEWIPPLANHFHDFLMKPGTSLALTPFLLNQPPLFDILPLYVVFLATTPLLVWLSRRLGWPQVVALSGVVWLAAQNGYGLNVLLRELTPGPVRLGSFEIFSWQFLWAGGMALGDTVARGKLVLSPRRHGLLVGLAATIALAGLLLRHGLWPDRYFSTDVYLWMDKWSLGPLRILDLAAWGTLLLAFNPKPPRSLVMPLAAIGRNSLFIFCFHIPLIMAATILIECGNLGDQARAILGLGTIAAVFACARWLEARRERLARLEAEARTGLTLQPVPLRSRS